MLTFATGVTLAVFFAHHHLFLHPGIAQSSVAQRCGIPVAFLGETEISVPDSKNHIWFVCKGWKYKPMTSEEKERGEFLKNHLFDFASALQKPFAWRPRDFMRLCQNCEQLLQLRSGPVVQITVNYLVSH